MKKDPSKIKESFLSSDAVMVFIVTLAVGWIISGFVWMFAGLAIEFMSWEINDGYFVIFSVAVGYSITAGIVAKQVYEDK